MPKIKPGLGTPDEKPRHAGRFLSYYSPQSAHLIARHWPTKAPSSSVFKNWWYRKQFAYAARWAANPLGLELETAIHLTKDREMVPRDYLTMIAYGRAYEIDPVDGTTWTYDTHAPPQETVEVTTELWTPTLTFASPGTMSFSYSEQYGVAAILGPLVLAWFRFDGTLTKGTASGNARIAGLPYPVADPSLGGPVFGGPWCELGASWNAPSALPDFTLQAVSGQDYLEIAARTDGVGTNNVTAASITFYTAFETSGFVAYLTELP